jgi:hypothetical protein
MYIIDVEYTEYETALTRERQEFGFISAMAVQGLSTAGAVFTPANTVRVLSALSSGVNASRGFYDAELLVNKTIQIAQSQMQAKRDDVATRILGRRIESILTYPLSAALHDLEDYYRAGTLTAGLIKAAGEAGEAARVAAGVKEDAIQAQAIIANVRQPLPAEGFRPRGVDPQALFDRQVAVALCVPLTGQSRELAIRDYLVGQAELQDPTVTSVTMTPRLQRLLNRARARVPNCQQAGFRNAFEVGRYGVDSASQIKASINSLQAALRANLNLSESALPNSGELDQKTRDAIATFRIQNNLKKERGGQVDAELLSKVR